jgi:RNA polymerase sigma factor (sigma-70 family)
MATSTTATSSGRRYLAAMVLGTALTAFNPGQTLAATTDEATSQAITDIQRYCTTCWRNARLPLSAWSDCTQEVFRRLLERIPTDAWERILQDEGDERRELVRAVDAVKKRTQRARKHSGSLDGVADTRSHGASERSDRRELVERAASEWLTPRQQHIMQLSFDGWSVQEIGTELALAPERVSDEKYKAIRKLRSHLNRDE